MSTGAKPSAAEQSKAVVAQLKKHHFWLLWLIVLATGVTVWYLATGTLEASFKKDSGAIDRSFSNLSGLGNQMRNEAMIEQIQTEQKKIVDQAATAWTSLYDRQKPLFVWPKDMAEVTALPPGKPISEALRGHFQQFVVEREWQKILWEAKPVLVGDEKPPTGYGTGKETPPLPVYLGIVDWPKAMRDTLIARYLSTEVPTDLRVRTAMEDMWIYQNIIEIIKDMNSGAKDQLEASIKRVRAIEIAQWAIKDAHAFQGPDIEEVTGKTAMGGGGGSIGGGRTFNPPNKSGSSHIPDNLILNGRYLDGDNRPTSGTGQPPFAEFRQMFVTMRFVMDQRDIPKLLVRCANAPFPIVARQVLTKYRDVDTTEKTDPFDAGAFRDFPLSPTDALVEVRGLIFLYDMPDATKLGTGSQANPAQRKFGIPPLE